MGWYVVKFEDDNTVEAVPKTWYSKDTKECNWPPSHLTKIKINDFIKFKKTPEYNWNYHKAVILGSYDELSVALRKANKAKYTSDLSSQNDELKTRRPSKREKKKTVEKNKSTRHLSDSESSNLSRSESDTNIYPCPSGLIINDKNLVQNLPTETATTSTTEIPRRIDADFQKHVLKEMNAVYLKLNDIMESMALLLKNKKIQDEPTITVNDIPHVVHLFPVNEQTLTELEQWLNADAQNKQKLIMELSRVGGLNVKDVTRRIMYRVFTNEVGMLYSWEGAKKRNALKI